MNLKKIILVIGGMGGIPLSALAQQQKCVPCPAGTYSNIATVGGINSCIDCPSNYWSAVGSTSCKSKDDFSYTTLVKLLTSSDTSDFTLAAGCYAFEIIGAGGGGAGGSNIWPGGGGGGGGLARHYECYSSSVTFTNSNSTGTYRYNVGVGGAAGKGTWWAFMDGTAGKNGGDTHIGGAIAYGGGGGQTNTWKFASGGAGGSYSSSWGGATGGNGTNIILCSIQLAGAPSSLEDLAICFLNSNISIDIKCAGWGGYGGYGCTVFGGFAGGQGVPGRIRIYKAENF